MFQSRKPNSSCGLRYTRKFCLRTDVSRDTQCSRALNMQLPHVIAERTIHHVMGGVLVGANETSCWQAKSRPLTKNLT